MFPALVGMNRKSGTSNADYADVPRTRGDEPIALTEI